jgi:hypothetical protein
VDEVGFEVATQNSRDASEDLGDGETDDHGDQNKDEFELGH